MKNYLQLLKNITTFIFDVDGVLTDGTVILLPDGEQVRTMNIKDGFAMQYAVSKGYRICIISKGKSEAVRKRMNLLGVKDVFLAMSDKIDTLEDYLISNDLKYEEILYMGDDLPDYECMKKAGIAVCPSDAAEEIKSISKYISTKKGGKGCVREMIEQVLKVQEKWTLSGK